MKLLKNRKFAAAVAAVVCVASMFLGANMSVARDVRKLDKMFNEGMTSQDGTYTQPSIASQIEASMDYSLGLYTIAKNYESDENVALWSDRYMRVRDSYFYQDNQDERKTVKSGTYHAMLSAIENLYNALQNVDMTERDAEFVGEYYKDLISSKTLIYSLADDYNTEVAKLYDLTNAVPARFLLSDGSEFNMHHSVFPPVSEIPWRENGWGAVYEGAEVWD